MRQGPSSGGDASLRAAVESLLDPWVLLAPVRDDAGTVVDFEFADANAAACDYNRKPRAELVGARLLDLLPGHAATGLLGQYAAAVETGQALDLDDLTYAQELLGSLPRRYLVRAVPVEDALSCTWRDVTGRYEEQERLAASEERFRRAFSESAIGMCLVSPDGRFLEVNAALCALFDRDIDEMASLTWQELTHPDDLDDDLALVASVVAGERDHYHLRKRFLRPDGTVVHGVLTVSGIRDHSSRLAYFVSQIVDVTEEVLAQTALERALWERRRLLDQLPVGVYAMRMTAQGDVGFDYVSPALCRLVGISEEALMADVRLAFDVAHPDDRPGLLAANEAAVAAVEPFTWEGRFLVSGQDRWVRLHSVPDRERSGDLVWHGVISDVTDEVRAREQAVDAAREFRLLAENSSDVVYRTGPDGRCVWVSPSVREVLGWEAADWVGRRMATLVHPDDLAEAERLRAAAVSDPEAYVPSRIELRYADVDAHWRWMSARGRPVTGAEGTVTGGVTALRDVHDEVTAREALREREEQYRAVAEHSSDVVLRSRSGIADWVSPSAVDVLGLEPEELVGTDLTRRVHPEDLDRLLAARSELEPGSVSVLRFRVLRGDRSWRWFEAQTRLWIDADGEAQGAVMALRDVDEAVVAQQQLEESRQLLRTTLDAMVDPWVLLAAVRADDGRIVDFEYADANPAACAANGLPRERLLGRRLLDLFPEHGPSGLLASYVRVLDTGEPLSMDDVPFPSRLHGGATRWFDNRAVQVGPDRLSFTWRDVTERYELRQRDALAARRDSLTGLPNRIELVERIQGFLARAARTGTERAVLYCDVDHFKQVNDRYGHAMGDQVLRTVALRIAGSVRAQDLVARMGGDEFVVVLDGVHDRDEAAAVAEKVRRAVGTPLPMWDDETTVTMSIGVTLVSDCGDPESCLHAADVALYRAKAEGRDRVAVA